MDQWALPTVAVALLAFAAVSGRLRSTPVSQAMVFVVLGLPVVTNRRLPSRIRQGLNVESGLNDGVCVPCRPRGRAAHSRSSTPPAVIR